jgi:hypothetical protein
VCLVSVPGAHPVPQSDLVVPPRLRGHRRPPPSRYRSRLSQLHPEVDHARFNRLRR